MTTPTRGKDGKFTGSVGGKAPKAPSPARRAPTATKDTPGTPGAQQGAVEAAYARMEAKEKKAPQSTHLPMTPQTAQTCVSQIGQMNVYAISGGRVKLTADGKVELPVSSGYLVRVEYDASDTYTVSRVLRRGDKEFIKGRETLVYADELGEVAYRASCFRSDEFGQ